MRIGDWLTRLSYELVQGSLDACVEEVIYDSRKARENSPPFCFSDINF